MKLRLRLVCCSLLIPLQGKKILARLNTVLTWSLASKTYGQSKHVSMEPRPMVIRVVLHRAHQEEESNHPTTQSSELNCP